MLLPFTGLFLQLLRKRPLITVEPLERYCWLTFGFVFVFFSLSGTIAPLSALRNQSVAVDGNQIEHLRARSLVVLPAVLLPVFVVLPELLGTPRQTDDAHQLMLASLLTMPPRLSSALCGRFTCRFAGHSE